MPKVSLRPEKDKSLLYTPHPIPSSDSKEIYKWFCTPSFSQASAITFHSSELVLLSYVIRFSSTFNLPCSSLWSSHLPHVFLKASLAKERDNETAVRCPQWWRTELPGLRFEYYGSPHKRDLRHSSGWTIVNLRWQHSKWYLWFAWIRIAISQWPWLVTCHFPAWWLYNMISRNHVCIRCIR